MTEIVDPNGTSTPPGTVVPPEPKWWLDDNTALAGDRPEWLPQKFKSVHDLSKSYTELESKIGAVPEDYDFGKTSWIDPDYKPFQELKDLAKSKRVPAEVMDKMVDSFDKYLNEFTTDPNEEREKLGDRAAERIELLNNWARSNLSDESFRALSTNLNKAETVKALEEIRGKMMSGTTTIPGGNEGSSTGAPTIPEIQQEMQTNLEKYKTDPNYRKELMLKLEMASKNSNYVEKSGA